MCHQDFGGCQSPNTGTTTKLNIEDFDRAELVSIGVVVPAGLIFELGLVVGTHSD